jgi:hypothetical protein
MIILSDDEYQELMRIREQHYLLQVKLERWLDGVNKFYRADTELYANTATILIIEKLEELLR